MASNIAVAKLTARERQVLALVAEGAESEEIASVFDVSKRAIDKIRWRLKKKLGAANPAEMIHRGWQANVLPLDPAPLLWLLARLPTRPR